MTVNYLAILLAGVASMVVGFLWYSPLLFGKVYAKVHKINFKDKKKIKKMQKEMGPSYLITFVMQLLTAYVAFHLITYLKVTTIEGALQFAFWIWLGFIATTQVLGQLFGKRSIAIWLVDTSHSLIVFVIQVLILVKF